MDIPHTLTSPRHAAYTVLTRLSGSQLHADDLIDHELSRGLLTGPDRGLFSELVFGVVRHQATLDHYLAQLVGSAAATAATAGVAVAQIGPVPAALPGPGSAPRRGT